MSVSWRSSLSGELARRLALERRAGLAREAAALPSGPGVLDFLSHDCLGLAGDAGWRRTLARCAARHAPSGRASWVAGGRTALADEAAAACAAYFGAAECRFFASGYQAQLAAVVGLLHPGQPLLTDRRMHASAVRFLGQSRARVLPYAHADMAHLERRLHRLAAEVETDDEAAGRQPVVMSESLFSMDGTLLDMPAWRTLRQRFGFWGWLDEAHSLGALGPQGRGMAAQWPGAADLVLGSLGKALGYWGAFLLLPEGFSAYLEQWASPLLHSTALPPAHAAGVLALLERLPGLDEQRQDLAEKARFFRDRLREAGLPVQGEAHILAVPVGDAAACAAWAARLRERGVLLLAARHPTVPQGRALLRCTVRTGHSRDDLRRAADCLARTAPRRIAPGDEQPAPRTRPGGGLP